MDFDLLIGLEISQARVLLSENGYNNIRVVMNSNDNQNYNKILVCAVKCDNDVVTLVCGGFYILKEIK